MKQLKRILHVEDVPSIQVVTRIALEKLGGFEVLSCQSGQAALDQVQAFAPDLILLDVILQPERLQELRQLGVRQVLGKPFDPLQLATQLRQIWEAEHG